MDIILIAAMAKNRTIGKDNCMPWHIPEELALFKRTTMGHPLIMGRRTFDSLGGPLPGRRHIVLSRNPSYRPLGGEYASDIEEALRLCNGAEKVFIIGGAQIFALSIKIATTILLTIIDQDFEGDVKFPDFIDTDFVEVSIQHYPDATIPFTVHTFHRRIAA